MLEIGGGSRARDSTAGCGTVATAMVCEGCLKGLNAFEETCFEGFDVFWRWMSGFGGWWCLRVGYG